MTRTRRIIAAVATAVALVLVPSAAWADYSVTGTVSGKTYLGADGISGVYKYYKITVGGKTFCIRSSSVSGNDPLNAAQFSRIFIRSGGTQSFGGFPDVVNGRNVTANVNESASPGLCGGLKLGYMVFVNL